ncbi:MAG: hypothetical protein ACXVEF_33320 [Polyangiales bacterium]
MSLDHRRLDAWFLCGMFVSLAAPSARGDHALEQAMIDTGLSIDEAVARAGDESFLQPEYRSIARGLLRIPRDRWPTCCGSNCEPCSTTLVRVADRALELLGRRDPFSEE